jgi:hypothetical protein
MKKILSIIRWIFGLMFCLAALTGISQGDYSLALFVLAIGLLLLPPVTQAIFKKRKEISNFGGEKEVTQSLQKTNFKSKINEIKFPDRVEAIVWHINAINKALKSGDLSFANLSYAKLIESIRQQNVNEENNYDIELKAIRDEYEEFRNTYKMDYPPQFLPPSERQKVTQTKQPISNNGVLINPNSNFSLTLYNAPSNIIQEVKKILGDENIWNKENLLMPLFTQYNIKCREIDEYITKYKPIYEGKIEELKSKSSDYQSASEMDKLDIEEELYEEAANSLYERAACDIDLLFATDDIDITIDDELINEFGYETVSKYIGYAYDIEKVRIDYERKDFEDLIKKGLAISGEEIPIAEILKQQTLKMLNSIANKEEGFFKRKEKAIEFITSDELLKKNLGNHISMRRIFKLKTLPEKYKNINLIELSTSWAFVKEQIKLIEVTYRDSKRYTEDIKGDKSWIKSFTIEKHEDYNSEFICQRAREACKKKYSKSNPPKLPLHIGCNCDLRID